MKRTTLPSEPSKKVIYALASYWDKDHRTIKSWFSDNDPMLEHPESKKIINSLSKKQKS